MGEVAVHALRDIDLDIYEREPSIRGYVECLNVQCPLQADVCFFELAVFNLILDGTQRIEDGGDVDRLLQQCSLDGREVPKRRAEHSQDRQTDPDIDALQCNPGATAERS